MDKTLDLDELEQRIKDWAAGMVGFAYPMAIDEALRLISAARVVHWCADVQEVFMEDMEPAYFGFDDPPLLGDFTAAIGKPIIVSAARPAETRDWSEFEDEISDAISDSIDMDWQSRDGAKAVVRMLNEAVPRTKPPETAWLIEWPADRQNPVRYWHPTEGHVIDPNHAVRFCRREDAEAVCKREHLFGGARPVEHKWVSK